MKSKVSIQSITIPHDIYVKFVCIERENPSLAVIGSQILKFRSEKGLNPTHNARK
jgi:hypothetical protein